MTAGAARLLSPLEVAMLAADRWRPVNIGAVLIVAAQTPRAASDLATTPAPLGSGTPSDPRLSAHPHRGWDTAGLWTWRRSPVFDAAQHVRRVTLPPGRAELWRFVARQHSARLDPASPMWECYVVDGFESGRLALYVKAQHALVDGVGGLTLLSDSLLSDTMLSDTLRRAPETTPDGRDPGPARAPRGGSSASANAPRGTAATVSAALSGARSAGRLVGGAAMTAAAHVLGDTSPWPLAAPVMRFNRRVGPDLVVAGAHWPLSRIHEVRRAASVTTHDVVTAAIAGGLRAWLLERRELPRRSLVAICPISAPIERALGSRAPGNDFGAWLCPLATDVSDPARRLDVIHRSMRRGKRLVAQTGRGSMILLAPSIAATLLPPLLTPSAWYPRAARGSLTGYNLAISHVTGPSTTQWWRGSPVERITPISAVFDGQAVNVTTCTYDQHVDVGYVAARAAVPDVERLVELTERALDALEVACHTTSRRPARPVVDDRVPGR